MIIGTVWAAWHFLPYLQLHEPSWALGQCAFTIVARVIIVWLHNNTGNSVFAAVLFHATMNVTYSVSTDGWSHNPAVTSLVMLIVATAAIVMWGPKTLSHYRFSRAVR
ncbi:hypothetical protein [Saccharopolyspora spinosa]|uniref:hypothetical protein n=1 Tax=Saccharopolyspora spinosa TaxID=60894 RepID=UPI0002379E59|nr:hypothetical protein [Saccharopolyspora spinosa]